MSQLLPCPFCSSPMHIGHDYDGDPLLCHPNGTDCILDDHSFVVDEDAWNKRTPSPGWNEAVEALAWYAEQVADCRKHGSDGDKARQALDKDGGKRASAALALPHMKDGGKP